MPKARYIHAVMATSRAPKTETLAGVTLVSPQAEEDLLGMHGAHASRHVTKPIDQSKFCRVVRTGGGCRPSLVLLPPGGEEK